LGLNIEDFIWEYFFHLTHLTRGRLADGPQPTPLGFVGFNESEPKVAVAWTREQRSQWTHWRFLDHP
jgi:hypothetical protein